MFYHRPLIVNLDEEPRKLLNKQPIFKELVVQVALYLLTVGLQESSARKNQIFVVFHQHFQAILYLIHSISFSRNTLFYQIGQKQSGGGGKKIIEGSKHSEYQNVDLSKDGNTPMLKTSACQKKKLYAHMVCFEYSVPSGLVLVQDAIYIIQRGRRH